MNQIEPEKFNKVKQRAEDFYKTISTVQCPYFRGAVNFNAKGLDHIKFKAWNRARLIEDQYMRLSLIHLAPEIIKHSSTLQGEWETKDFVRVKTNSRWETVMKCISFYEFIAVIDNTRAKVIVKKVEGGEKFFWSIIPFWGVDKNTKQRILHSGKPEFD